MSMSVLPVNWLKERKEMLKRLKNLGEKGKISRPSTVKAIFVIFMKKTPWWNMIIFKRVYIKMEIIMVT
jgi:hypothetical protein